MNVLASVSLAVCVYAASLVPFFLLIDADHLTPRGLIRAAATWWARVSSVRVRVVTLNNRKDGA